MLLPSVPVEPKEKSLPETSKTDQSALNESGSDDRYSWTDVVVEDTVKNLIWQRREIGQQTFNGAKEYCEQLQLDGSNEWWLPEIAELRELNSQILPIFYTGIFQHPLDTDFWSGSLIGSRVWTINLWTGRAGTIDPYQNQRQFLCIRSNESGQPINSSRKAQDLGLYQKIQQANAEVVGCGFFMWAVPRNHWPCPRIKTAFTSRGIDGFTFGVRIDPGQTLDYWLTREI